MPRKKENPKTQPDPSMEELESQGLELKSYTLEAEAKKELTDEQLKLVKKISYYVSKVGLELEEACLLVDTDYDQFRMLIDTTPVVRRIIAMKELEYKKDLLKTLSDRARGGDDKLAQWLLERRHPDQYGNNKKKGGGGDGKDILFEAIQFIQKTGDASPLVRETSGAAIVIKKVQSVSTPAQAGESETMKQLRNLLK